MILRGGRKENRRMRTSEKQTLTNSGKWWAGSPGRKSERKRSSGELVVL